MRTRPQLIPWILTFAITGAAVVLRFVQLLLFTDSSTGRVTAAGAPLTYGLYALLLCASVCCTVCALHQSHTAVAVAANGGSRRLTVVSYLVSVAFFFDFIYRCFLCYDLADGAVYLQWNDLVSEGLTALFALLSCSYYFVVGRSYGGGRYDFRAFRFFHFVPALWGLCRLLTILAKMVSVLVDTQTVCEVLFWWRCCCFSYPLQRRWLPPAMQGVRWCSLACWCLCAAVCWHCPDCPYGLPGTGVC